MAPPPPEQQPLPAESTPPHEPRLLTRDEFAGEARPALRKLAIASIARLRRQRRIPPTAPASREATRRGRSSWSHLLAAVFTLALLGAASVIVLALWLRHAMQASLPQLDGQLAVAGLSAPVTVTRDMQGVPSIHSSNLDDLLFAQGFVTAQDRLWQMDLLRRHAAGELAEILGRGLIEHDRRQRYLQIRAAADRSVGLLPPDQLHQLQAYARGVNAFIDSHAGRGRTPDRLPVEFHLLHYTPSPWTPRDSLLVALAMSEDLSTEFPQKLNREELSAYLPANLLPDLYPVGSWRDHPPSQLAPDLTAPQPEIEQIPLDRSQSLNRPPDATPQALLANFVALSPDQCGGCRSGSNNWAIAGSRSASGAPLLSNDMHLGLSMPSLWYEASLHVEPAAAAGANTSAATPLDVTGFTLPGIPYVIAGRNDNVAWGFTNTGADVQDLRIEHLRGEGANTEFERPDGSWELAGHQTEHIHVRGGRDLTFDVLTTTHSIGTSNIQTPVITPIISPVHPREHRALSLAWPIYDPSTLTVPLLSIDTASDAASLVAAFAGFGNVSQNLVYADAHHIGYHMLGRIPIRGPAIQRPRATPPFILPDRTPEDDEEDESGEQARLPEPSTSTNPSPRAHLVRGFTANPRSRVFPAALLTRTSRSRQADPQQIPQQPDTPYTIGSPISPVPVDALDPAQVWSGYIPYSALPSVLDPSSGIVATANARVAPDNFPYFLANNWADPYRVERIDHLLGDRTNFTPADMLRIETDVHSEFDLALAQHLSYALDHASPAMLAHDSRRLHQAADILRQWNGDLTPDSAAAAIVSVARAQLWPMLLVPQIRGQIRKQIRKQSRAHERANSPAYSPEALAKLYTWNEKASALEELLEHTPARWLPPGLVNWNDLLATCVEKSLQGARAPGDLASWRYGSIHSVEIDHPIFGSNTFLRDLLGRATGTGLHPDGGDSTTIDATGLHFGPSERFTADLSNPDASIANITTGESGNPASPWYLDQFLPWLEGTSFSLPLNRPVVTHTLVLEPK